MTPETTTDDTQEQQRPTKEQVRAANHAAKDEAHAQARAEAGTAQPAQPAQQSQPERAEPAPAPAPPPRSDPVPTHQPTQADPDEAKEDPGEPEEDPGEPEEPVHGPTGIPIKRINQKFSRQKRAFKSVEEAWADLCASAPQVKEIQLDLVESEDGWWWVEYKPEPVPGPAPAAK